MEIAYTPAQAALRNELRAYYDELLDDETMREVRADSVGPTAKRVWKQMCADGWAGLELARRSTAASELDPDRPVHLLRRVDARRSTGADPDAEHRRPDDHELRHRGAEGSSSSPGSSPATSTSPSATPSPEAGTDLAALQCRAVRDGDEYVINGQKMWTSLAGGSDYLWLAVRTDQEAKKHKGISVLIVPLDTPGITLQPLTLMASHDINATFFDDVRVPVTNLVGEENGGWGLITNQLNHERVTLCASGSPERNLTDVRRWAQETLLPDGRRVIDQEWVQLSLARVHARLEFLRLANWKVAWSAEQQALHPADASTVKVFGTEFYLEAYRLLMEILGPRGYVKEGSPADVLRGRLEAMIRGVVILTFGGGTNELQRDLIAMFGLGFPRSR